MKIWRNASLVKTTGFKARVEIAIQKWLMKTTITRAWMSPQLHLSIAKIVINFREKHKNRILPFLRNGPLFNIPSLKLAVRSAITLNNKIANVLDHLLLFCLSDCLFQLCAMAYAFSPWSFLAVSYAFFYIWMGWKMNWFLWEHGQVWCG